MNSRLFLPLGVLVAIGCAPVTTVTPVGTHSYPATPETCDIAILTQAPTDRKYEELGILNTIADQSTNGRDLNAMLPSMKAKACALGADAIILKGVDAGPAAEIIGGGGPRKTGTAWGVAIKFLVDAHP